MRAERRHPPQRSSPRRLLLPGLVVLFLGSLALGLWFLIHPALSSNAPYYRVGWRENTYKYGRFILLLFVPYALALLAWWRGARAPLWLLLAGALVLHLVVLFAPLPQSQDFYQYLFYGKMQAAHGANPYLVHPIHLYLDPWYPWIRWDNQTSVYGPVWMAITYGVAKLSGSSLPAAVVLLKLVILALDVSVMAMIVVVARGRNGGRGCEAGWGILAYGWNPLIWITVPLAGTVDVALGAAFLGAYLARRRNRMVLTTILLTAASLVKAYAAVGLLLHLALLARERGGKEAAAHTAGSAGLAVAAYAPYWGGMATFGGLARMAGMTNQSFSGTIQRLLVVPLLRLGGIHPSILASEAVTRVAVTAALLAVMAWAVQRVRDERTLWFTVVAVLSAYFYLTPWFLYWYLVAPLILVSALPRNRLTLPLLAFSGSSMFLLVFSPSALALSLQTLLRFGIPLLVYAAEGIAVRGTQPSVVSPPAAIRLPATAATTRQRAVAD